MSKYPKYVSLKEGEEIEKQKNQAKKELEDRIINTIKEHQKKDHFITVSWIASHLGMRRIDLHIVIGKMVSEGKVKQKLMGRYGVVWL